MICCDQSRQCSSQTNLPLRGRQQSLVQLTSLNQQQASLTGDDSSSLNTNDRSHYFRMVVGGSWTAAWDCILQRNGKHINDFNGATYMMPALHSIDCYFDDSHRLTDQLRMTVWNSRILVMAAWSWIISFLLLLSDIQIPLVFHCLHFVQCLTGSCLDAVTALQ